MTARLSRSEIEVLARARFGELNERMSTRDKWRYGTHGSKRVNPANGRWEDFETGDWGYFGQKEPKTAGTVASASRGEARCWSREAEDIWRSALPITGTAAELYLRGRGCWIGDVTALRFMRAWCGWPAMVALVTDAVSNLPLTLHFTLLKRDGSGKAPVDRPKLLLKGHRKSGGVIRLSADDEVTTGLGLGEGVETSLSIIAAGWRPLWVAIDAGNMRYFPVLGGIEALTLFTDHDPAGIAAARECARRWEHAGREAAVVMPTGRGADYNDTIRGEAR